jgi:hypothetical protein
MSHKYGTTKLNIRKSPFTNMTITFLVQVEIPIL